MFKSSTEIHLILAFRYSDKKKERRLSQSAMSVGAYKLRMSMSRTCTLH